MTNTSQIKLLAQELLSLMELSIDKKQYIVKERSEEIALKLELISHLSDKISGHLEQIQTLIALPGRQIT